MTKVKKNKAAKKHKMMKVGDMVVGKKVEKGFKNPPKIVRIK